MKKIIFFEVQGGSDKGEDGHRKDTMPMVHALKQKGWDAEVLFFEIENRADIFNYAKNHACAYISRINPGNLKGETEYFSMLRQLCQEGMIGMPHPDAMMDYGTKDALVKLAHTPLVPRDTYAYYNMDDFKKNFPKTLAKRNRVIKQNRGSTGEGIWRIQLLDELSDRTTAVPDSYTIKCTEAKDNHVEIWKLDLFMEHCRQYMAGDYGMLIDMPFLPRIKEGEIRLFMLRNQPIKVVHKKPASAENAFSATLFSGAQYRYDSPTEWKELVEHFTNHLPTLTERLGNHDLPLIWTADFILDYDEDGNDAYVLSELNCSCVGFTSELALAKPIADEIINIIEEKRNANKA